MFECHDSQEGMESQLQSLSQHEISRRSFMKHISILSTLSIGGSIAALYSTDAYAAELPEVEAIPPGSVSRSSFALNEQRVARYLATLAPLANSVEDVDAATYGFITGGFWRTPDEPFNARIMENNLTMAYFYSTQRTWNRYYNNQALKQRLEAALNYWISLQKPDGGFPQNSADESERAATGFGLTYVAYMLKFLDAGPGISATIRANVLATARKATDWFLAPSNSQVWASGSEYSNQIVGGMLGIALLRSRFNDATLNALFLDRIRYIEQAMQSSAGHFRERAEADHGYSFAVMTPDMALLYEETKLPEILSMQQKYFDWLQYNFIWQPDGSGYMTNDAINGRTTLRALDAYVSDVDKAEPNYLWPQYIAQSAAYRPTAEARSADRTAWSQGSWEDIQPWGTGQMDPFLLRVLFYPDKTVNQSTKQAAITTLPYLKSTSFTEYRVDSKQNYQYLFVRRPSYYVGLTLNKRTVTNSPKRTGLSFLWHPQMGTLIHTLSGSESTWSAKQQQQEASQDLPAKYFNGSNRQEVTPTQLNQTDKIHVNYAPPDKWCNRWVTMEDIGLNITIAASGSFNERIPLVVLPTDTLRWLGSSIAPAYNVTSNTTARGFSLLRNGQTFVIEWGPTAIPVSFSTSATTFFKDAKRKLHVLNITAQNTLNYRVRFTSGAVTIVDDLNDWGKTSSHTNDWAFDSTNPQYTENDTARIKRNTTNTTQSVVYNYTNISSFSAKLYYRVSMSGRISIDSSTNGTIWSPVALKTDTPLNTSSDWYRVNYSPTNPLPASTNFIRVEFKNDALIYTPQLGQITLTYNP